jgi:hypothetical protein
MERMMDASPAAALAGNATARVSVTVHSRRARPASASAARQSTVRANLVSSSLPLARASGMAIS